MATESMLTTVDNPYSPFTEWAEWYEFDYRHGYHTPGLLARVAFLSDEMSDDDEFDTLEAAMDEIVSENVSGVHKKVTRDSSEEPI